MYFVYNISLVTWGDGYCLVVRYGEYLQVLQNEYLWCYGLVCPQELLERCDITLVLFEDCRQIFYGLVGCRYLLIALCYPRFILYLRPVGNCVCSLDVIDCCLYLLDGSVHYYVRSMVTCFD
eukprot:gene3222-2204_t